MTKLEPTRTSSDLTATECLRRMLDERGVEYRFSGCTKVFDWHFNGANGEGDACATEVQGGINILARGITPEQAIAATLGAETCFPALDSERDGLPYLNPRFVCSECGCQLTESRLGRIWQNYCPNCGRRIRIRRVVDE